MWVMENTVLGPSDSTLLQERPKKFFSTYALNFAHSQNILPGLHCGTTMLIPFTRPRKYIIIKHVVSLDGWNQDLDLFAVLWHLGLRKRHHFYLLKGNDLPSGICLSKMNLFWLVRKCISEEKPDTSSKTLTCLSSISASVWPGPMFWVPT